MIIKHVELETVCGVTSSIPENTLPEVAFAGKSNVGKSSLINALMNRRSLARTSSKPGKTQTINFYNINGQLYLVDLPGYGYATAGEAIRAQWGTMIENYLHTSGQLRAVFLLIDIRHEPSENDRLMYRWMLERGFAPIIIATKSDKLKRSRLREHVEAIRNGLQMEPGTVILPFSAVSKDGLPQIWEQMEELAGLREQESSPERSGKTAREPSPDKPGKTARESSPDKPGKTARESSPAKARKPRWKSEGRPVAKKTKRNRQRKNKER